MLLHPVKVSEHIYRYLLADPYDYEYMRLCGGEMYIKAEEIRKKVKNLSTPDYKIFNRERLMEFSKNYSHAINCQENKKEKISNFDYYISQLEKKQF